MVTASIWEAADPLVALAAETDNPTRVFLLNEAVAQGSDAGASQGPFGSIRRTTKVVMRPRSPGDEVDPALALRTESTPQERKRREPAVGAAVEKETPAPMPVATSNNPTVSPFDDEPAEFQTMPPMPPMPTAAQVASGAADGPMIGAENATAAAGQPRREEPDRSNREATDLSQPDHDRRLPVKDQEIVRTSEQLLAILHRLGSQGGVIRIAAGAVLDLPATVIEGTGRFQLLAEPGGKRPLLRFRPAQAVQRSPVAWTVMLDLRAGLLHLQGVDLVVPDVENLRTDRLAVVGLLPGAEFTMTDCTMTLAVNRPGAALFVVQPEVTSGGAAGSGGTSGQSAVVHLRDCFLRSGGEGVVVAGGRRIDLMLSNVLTAAESSLVHAFGGARAGRAEFPAVKIHLSQVTARIKAGLVHLDSTPEQPELPFTSILAENTILSTANHDDPLFRLDGRDQLDELENKIQWDGRKIAYDRIKTYRRDEVARTGGTPRIYNRADWTSAFRPKDESPILGDVSFFREIDPAQPAWRLDRDDLRLAPQSPLGDTGPDVSRIPEPPSEGGL